MPTIENFLEVREDGNILHENIDIDDIHSAQLTVGLKWTYDGKTIEIADKLGLLALIVPNRSLVCVIKNLNVEQTSSSLEIYSGNGELLGKIPNTLHIAGKERLGNFMWFERWPDQPTGFEVIFEEKSYNMSQWRVFIDAATGVIHSWSEHR